MIKTFLKSSLDILYPPECHFCNEPLEYGASVCGSCQLELRPVQSPCCEQCGEPYDGVIEETFACPNCHGMEFAFDFAIAAIRNGEKARELVHSFKYGKQRHLSRAMAKLMAITYEQDARFRGRDWVLVPTPLHWTRRMRRTFNQSEDLAKHLASELKVEVKNLLLRQRRTVTQTRLSRSKRLQNLAHCFRLKDECSGRNLLNIILVDDVLTTGSTAHECARTLRSHKDVGQIAVLTFLRG